MSPNGIPDGAESGAPDPVIRPFAATFVDPGLEAEYRAAHQSEDARTLLVLLLIVLPANMLWLISDYFVATSGAGFGLMAVVRVVIIATGVAALAICFRTRSPRLFTAAVLATAIVSAGGIFFFDLTRPRDYMGHYTIDTIVIAALYFAVPLPVRLQVACSSAYTVALLAVYFTYKETNYPNLYTFSIPLAVGIANIVGYMASRSLATRRRREFHLLHRESEARRQLQAALDNIKTLSGLLPICAGCKKVRDDKGYWNHLEAYLTAHSDAAITHGLCPECSERYREELEPAE